MSYRWIPVEEKLPRLGEWIFDDRLEPNAGVRRSACVPVKLKDGDHSWGEFAECTFDHGETIVHPDWNLWDSMAPDDAVVVAWFELPR